MAQSPEFPAYRWIPPRSYTRGRVTGQPSVIVIHSTEGSEGPNSAESGAAYDQRRTDGTSAHFYVDSNSVVQCVRTIDEAHTQAGRGNDIGISIEVCGRASQSSAQWNDAVSKATIERLAGLCRTLLRKYPRVRLINLTPAQLRAGQRWAFCEHKDVSLAWGETDHTDPGRYFPWGRLFALIRDGEEDVNLTDKIKLRTGGEVAYSDTTTTVEGILASTNYYVLVLRQNLAAQRAEVSALRSVVDTLAAVITSGGGSVDVAAVLAGVDARLATLPELTADAVIAEIAS